MATYPVFQADQLFNIGKNYLISNPSSNGPWNMNPGSRVRTLTEAYCIISAMTAQDYYLKLNQAIFESTMNSFQHNKLTGFQSSGSLIFSRTGTTGDISIPLGTRIIAYNGKVIETIAAGTIDDGDTDSLAIAAQATEVGTDGNFIILGLNTVDGTCNFVDTIDGVENVKNSTAFTGGDDEETDNQQLARFRGTVNGLTTSTKQGLLKATLDINGVKSADVIINYPEKGVNTIYADDGTGSLSPALETEILKVLNGDSSDPINYPGKAAAGITCLVSAPQITLVDIALTIYRLPAKSITDATLITLAETAIQSYLNTRRFSEDVILEAVDTAVMNCHPEVYDVVITNPTANVVITGYYLARAGTITITVVTRSEP